MPTTRHRDIEVIIDEAIQATASPTGKERWPAERDEELKRHISAGLSAAQAAVIMGVTRNAIVGRAWRIGAEKKNAAGRAAIKLAAQEREPEIRRLVEAGHSRSEIAKMLKVSYETIRLGIRRLGIGMIAKDTRAQTKAKSFGGPRVAFVRRAAPMMIEAATPSSQRKTFADLEPHHCRFIIGDPRKDWFFCGAKKLRGHSYCYKHCLLCYRAGERR